MVTIEDVLDKEELSFWRLLIFLMSVGTICISILLSPFIVISILFPRVDVILLIILIEAFVISLQLALAILVYWRWRLALPRTVRVEEDWLIVQWGKAKEMRLRYDECRWKEGTTKEDHLRWLLRRRQAIVLLFPAPGRITVGREPHTYARWREFAEGSLTRVDGLGSSFKRSPIT